MSEELFKVIICTSVPVTRPTGVVSQDTIQTYYDASWKQVLAYRKKFDGEITIERQSRALGLGPKIETGTSAIGVERYPSVLRPHSDVTQDLRFKRTNEPTITYVPKTPLPGGTYADLINVMMEEAK